MTTEWRIAAPPAIIQRRISESEIRHEERERAAAFLEKITQRQLPEMLRKCGFGDEGNDDGWADLSPTELHLLRVVAAKIRLGKTGS
jgi:hypothetical protein